MLSHCRTALSARVAMPVCMPAAVRAVAAAQPFAVARMRQTTAMQQHQQTHSRFMIAPLSRQFSLRTSSSLLSPVPPSRSAPSSAAAAAAAAAAGRTAAANAAAPIVNPPRLVYEFTGAPKFLLLSVLNMGQSIFWGGIYALSYVDPEVPMWCGSLGITMGLAFGAAIHLRAKRVVQEIAIYDDFTNIRVRSSTWLGRPFMQDVPLRSIGPNPNPTPKSGEAPAYFTMKLPGQSGYYVIDREGEIFDLHNFNKVMGYDVRSKMPPHEVHLLKIHQ